MALSGKVALVTGAAMGIGRAMTEELLKNGAKVVLLDINTAAGKTLVEALEKKFGKEKTLFVECNVESEEQLKATTGQRQIIGDIVPMTDSTTFRNSLTLTHSNISPTETMFARNVGHSKTVDTFGGIDIVCNNAGILNETDWEKTVSINLLGMIRVSYVALEHMKKQSGGRGGVIVNTASLAGLGPLPSCPVYTATKHGVIGFTRAMALASLGSDYGVRFNALCPGFVETDLFTNIPERLGKFSHLKELTQGIVDKFGIMNVSQVAEGLMELLLDETKTGQALTILPIGRKYVEFTSHV